MAIANINLTDAYNLTAKYTTNDLYNIIQYEESLPFISTSGSSQTEQLVPAYNETYTDILNK